MVIESKEEKTIYGYEGNREVSYEEMKKEIKSTIEDFGQGVTIERIVSTVENRFEYTNCPNTVEILSDLIREEKILMSCEDLRYSGPMHIVFLPK